MDYDEFTTHLTAFLWKPNDAKLIASLPTLIRMAEAELNRTLKVEERHTSVGRYVSSLRVDLPNDYHSMRNISDDEGIIGRFDYITPSQLFSLRAARGVSEWLPFYSIQGDQLLLCGPVEDPRETTGDTPPPNPQEGDFWNRTTGTVGLYVWQVDGDSGQWVQLTAEYATHSDDDYANINITVDYNRKVPDFGVALTSWVADKYLDIYVYCVLKQTAPFLREDERLQVWTSLYNEGILTAVDDSAFEKARGPSAAMPLPRQASVHRRRR